MSVVEEEFVLIQIHVLVQVVTQEINVKVGHVPMFPVHHQAFVQDLEIVHH